MKKDRLILQPDPESVKKLCLALNCHPVIAAILINRKIFTAEDARCFLNATFGRLRPPFAMKDVEKAVSRIIRAITHNEKMLIFGDYDADGITATTVLYEFFKYTGADVSYYIPHRIKEGYSLQVRHIYDYAVPKKIALIITADCGSDSHDAVKAAGSAGIDVIVTDHHTLPGNLPPALAVLNPKRHDCTAGFEDLAGVGVAFNLLICIRKQLRNMGFWQDLPEFNLKDLCDLVAIGTVADMVPLNNENRIFTKAGLKVINSVNRPGIKALMKVAGIQGRQADAEDIAFRLAPRLNAAGRVDHANTAVELLMAENAESADRIARSLNNMNMNRQHIEKNILEQILDSLRKMPQLTQKDCIVLSHHEWHLGVLGIVASRLVKMFYRPVVLVSTKDDIGRGSARSIPGFDLYEGLSACSEVLERFGGHAMAAGLTIKTDKIDMFQSMLEKVVRKMTKPEDFKPTISVDFVLDFADIKDQLIDQLETLKPFGVDIPEPVFIAKNIKVLSSKIVGKNHRRMLLTQTTCKTDISFQAIHFNIDQGIPWKDYYEEIAYKLRWNYWNGKKTAQIIIEDM